MSKFVMVVQSQPKPGRDDEYNEWYDTAHLQDILDIPGIKSGRRFEAAHFAVGDPGLPYLAIFEVEADDPTAVMTEMSKRGAGGTMHVSDALDAPATHLWFYKAR